MGNAEKVEGSLIPPRGLLRQEQIQVGAGRSARWVGDFMTRGEDGLKAVSVLRPAGSVVLKFAWVCLGSLQLVAVFPAEIVAGREIGSPFVVFPNFAVKRLAWHSAQRALLENVTSGVAIELQEPGLLGAIPAIGKNDQNLALHLGAQHDRKVRRPPPFSDSVLRTGDLVLRINLPIPRVKRET